MPEPATILVYSGLELIGDGLMKLPFLRALRAAYPAARITWLAGIGPTVFASSLAGLAAPYIDEVIESAGIGHGWRELARRPLPGRRFDLVIDTQRRVGTALALRRIRHGRFISGALGFLLSDARPPGWRGKQPRLVDTMLDLVSAASGQEAMRDTTLRLDPVWTARAAAALPAGPRYAGIAPGAGGRHKCWPRDRFAALAVRLQGRGFTPVFLLGPDEAGWRGELDAACPGALFPHTGSPLDTIALADRLAVAVANDSGAGHMIAAADAPLVSLFGPTGPAKFAPFVTQSAVLRAQEHGGDAMAAIPLQAVEAAMLRIAR